MLGLPITSWIRFYLSAFVAGVLLCFVRFGPMLALGVIEMILGLCGMIVVTIYTRSYLPSEWRRWVARARRAGYAMVSGASSLLRGGDRPHGIS